LKIFTLTFYNSQRVAYFIANLVFMKKKKNMLFIIHLKLFNKKHKLMLNCQPKRTYYGRRPPENYENMRISILT